MTYNKLRGAIREKYVTQEAFARAMGVNPATLSCKLTDKTDWSKAEMAKAAELLGIRVDEVFAYFFAS